MRESHRWGRWSIYSAWKPDGHIASSNCAEALVDGISQLTSCSKAAGSFEATEFAAVNCSHDIWSKIIEHSPTCIPVSILHVRDTHWLSDCLHIVSELHLELGLLRTILPLKELSINACRKKMGTNPRSAILAGARDGCHFSETRTNLSCTHSKSDSTIII